MPCLYHLAAPAVTGPGHSRVVRAELLCEQIAGTGDGPPARGIGFRIEGIDPPHPEAAAFFPVALLAAMRTGGRLIVNGGLPEEWEISCRTFQEIARSVCPGLAPVRVEAAWVSSSAMARGCGEAVVFGGDLDSLHAIASSAPTHLLDLAAEMDGGHPDPSIGEASARVNRPLIRIIPTEVPDRGASFDPWSWPAIRVATAVNLLAGGLARVTWGSPRGWLSPLEGKDHFALAECFARREINFRCSGRADSRMEKWRVVSGHDSTRGFPDVISRERERAAEAEMDDPEATDPDGQLAARLRSASRIESLDAWSRQLAALTNRATSTPNWTKLARRLFPVVLATAAANDRAWLKHLAVSRASDSSQTRPHGHG